MRTNINGSPQQELTTKGNIQEYHPVVEYGNGQSSFIDDFAIKTST